MVMVYCRRCGAESQEVPGTKFAACACGGTREVRPGLNSCIGPRGSSFVALDPDGALTERGNYHAAALPDSDEAW